MHRDDVAFDAVAELIAQHDKVKESDLPRLMENMRRTTLIFREKNLKGVRLPVSTYTLLVYLALLGLRKYVDMRVERRRFSAPDVPFDV